MLKQFLSQLDPTNKTISQLGDIVYGKRTLTQDLKNNNEEKELRVKFKKTLPKTSLKKQLPDFSYC